VTAHCVPALLVSASWLRDSIAFAPSPPPPPVIAAPAKPWIDPKAFYRHDSDSVNPQILIVKLGLILNFTTLLEK
jgi:hypothetical protein